MSRYYRRGESTYARNKKRAAHKRVNATARRRYRRTKKYGKKVQRIRRRWPGFTAPRPKTPHYEVLHQAWSRGRGNWYLTAFTSDLESAKKAAGKLGRPGDYAIRKVVKGVPSQKFWALTKVLGSYEHHRT